MSFRKLYKNIRSKLQKDLPLSPIWQRGVSLFSCFCACLLSGLLLGQVIVNVEIEDAWGWLKAFDVVLVIFILIDFLILWKMSSAKGLKNEKLVLWGLVGLLGLNAAWGMGMEVYKEVYEFQIGWNYLIIVLGFLSLKMTRGKIGGISRINTEVEREKRNENLTERKRKREFPQKFPRINKVPIVRGLIRWMYKEGWKYSIGLIMILILFVSIRAPYMDNTFGGVVHSGKYASYLPSLVNMYEKHDPFLNQNPKYTSIFNNEPDYTFESFGVFPFFRWEFLPFMPLTKFISLELLVRSLLTTQGVILLSLVYLFFKKIFSKKIALIGILLLAFNQLFQLVTYITVMDLPALIFMFAALNLYLNKNKNLSYVFCGLSVLAKYSFALIICPALMLLILFKKKDDIYNLAKLTLFSILPMFLFKILIDPIPSKTFIGGILRLLLVIFLMSTVYYSIKKKDKRFKGLIDKINERVKYILILLLPIIAISFVRKYILSGLSNFLTNQYLIFNWEMYSEILQQIKELIPNPIYYVLPLGFIISLAAKKHWRISSSLFLAGLVYLTMAPGGIFPHIYYKHIFLILLILSFCYVLNLAVGILKDKTIKITLLTIIIILLIIPSYFGAKNMLNKEKNGTYEMSEYLQSVLDEKDKMITVGSDAQVFAIYNNTKVMPYTIRGREVILKEIQENGFIKTMGKYNVRYYMTAGKRDFKDILPWFDEKINFYCKTGMGSIQSKAEQRECISQDKLEKIYEIYEPYQYFELEKNFGDFYLYRIKDT